MIYTRKSWNTFFLWPACAIGTDQQGLLFFEIAWLCWAVGFGEQP